MWKESDSDAEDEGKEEASDNEEEEEEKLVGQGDNVQESCAPLGNIKLVQFGVLSPDELVSIFYFIILVLMQN